MNEYDNKLYHFFYDLEGVEDYRDISPSLNNFYRECCHIMAQKKYSSLDLQDVRGNTYLHYAMRYSKWDWVYRLFEHGAQPFIRNKEKRHAFHVAKNLHQWWDYLRTFDLHRFDLPSWGEKLKNFHPESKSLIVSYFLPENRHRFESFKDLVAFLHENQISSYEGKYHIIAKSHAIALKERIGWYMENEKKDTYSNTTFLDDLFAGNLTEIKHAEQEVSQLLDLDFRYCVGFYKLAKQILYKNNDANNMLAWQIIAVIKKRNFMLPHQGGYALKKLIVDNAVNHYIFLEDELQHSVENNKLVKV